MQLRHVPLENAHVRLVPFSGEADEAELKALAARAPDVFRFWSHRGPGDWVSRWIEVIRKRIEAGTLLPYGVRNAESGAFIGFTAYLDPHPTWRTVEIGMTAYAPEHQGTVVNPACKRLLLGHAFEAGAHRVYFHVDTRNERSQAAMRKLGAHQDGILREHRILPDGYIRSTVLFSILEQEWPGVKAGLDRRLAP